MSGLIVGWSAWDMPEFHSLAVRSEFGLPRLRYFLMW